ncbi:polyprenyl synthetase family protein [Sphingobacterium yanglingense]|uniref:Geranylgeranyl diphosphate synthase type II n=1 Tax=Sphingobacterium yanglingense TaxID=1437280 RepID=A0A4R6WF76_9SPHI|nr:polyprenyl synthetase family protein [Sphingobacterium yanglingense]TDQ76657.1 geranylgeranyl diphosphate synthase type II [Sphingobacterium yanglingense]
MITKSVFGNAVFSDKISEALGSVQFPDGPTNLYQPIKYILSLAGKRVRPQLVILGADLFGHSNIEEVVPASVAIEYFHNFTLIHDDIMDKAPLRRGQETVHQKWNEDVAILSGDALLIKAYEQLAKCPAIFVPSLLTTFNKVALEVCEGQQMDMDFETLESVSEEEYVNMIRLKTSVLLGGALEMGAIIAGATSEQRNKVYDFGENLGIAFQLQDDILDAFGDPATFGKQIGGDIIVNKKTILHILLKEELNVADSEVFASILKMTSAESSEKIVQMKGLYEKYDVLSKANALKEYYTQCAYTSLSQIDVVDKRKEELFSLADHLMYRAR